MLTAAKFQIFDAHEHPERWGAPVSRSDLGAPRNLQQQQEHVPEAALADSLGEGLHTVIDEDGTAFQVHADPEVSGSLSITSVFI